MKQHTVVLLVGPSSCGKSVFTNKFVSACAEEFLTCKVISAEQIRRQLLCDDNNGLWKFSSHFTQVSEDAYDIMFSLLEKHTSFPINTDVIVIDSTGLSEEFRNTIVRIANKNHYKTDMYVFDYPRTDLESFASSQDGDVDITMRQMKTLREKVMPTLNRSAYHSVKIFKKPEDAFSWQVEIENNNTEVFVPQNDPVTVISDVHECVTELKLLLEKTPKSGVTVLLGDMFDKGNNSKEMFDVVMQLAESANFIFLRGNHERYVYKRLKNLIPKNEKLENEFFQSLLYFQSDEEIAKKFIDFYELRMANYVKIDRGTEKPIFINHAPCSNLYIGKHDTKSTGHQINFYFSSRDNDKMIDELSFVEKESNHNHPWHVFGHVAHDGNVPKMFKNKIFLDTGCVHGGKLSAAVFRGRHVDFLTVDSIGREKHGLISLEKKQSKIEKILSSELRLSEDDEKAANRVIKSGTMFISGTMAPAPSVDLNIESLEAGLNEFKKAGAKSVVLQPKYMGSRCQVYLHSDKDKNFACSRNGFKIKIPGIQEYLSLYQDHIKTIIPFKEKLILDGELLPWYALGSGLIEKEFKTYDVSVKETMKILDEDQVFQGFDIGNKINTKHQLVCIDKFSEQLHLFGQESPLEFKPFDVLMIDDEVTAGMDNERISIGIRINFEDEDHLEKAKKYYDDLTLNMGYEGIVIKPIKYDGTTLPYMKVRNPEYLRLIYGHDYDITSRLEKLCRQKSVTKKARVSVDEFEIGLAMLREKDVEKKNHLIRYMFGAIAKEKTLDPRL